MFSKDVLVCNRENLTKMVCFRAKNEFALNSKVRFDFLVRQESNEAGRSQLPEVFEMVYYESIHVHRNLNSDILKICHPRTGAMI